METREWVRLATRLLWLSLVTGCGSRTGLDSTASSSGPDQATGGPGGARGNSWTLPAESFPPELCPATQHIDTGCVDDVNEGARDLCNDLDDDCDGQVDEGCPCTPGSVKTCFAGPPTRRGVGACRDGFQACETTMDQAGQYGPCLGGISPTPEICDNLDNDCNGCRDEITGCVPLGSCPAPGDPRIPTLHPFERFGLNGRDYFDGAADSFNWSIQGGPCDLVAPTGNKSFELANATSTNASFMPRLSGEYTVTLGIVDANGDSFRCDWVIPVRGPGLRIEMCYPESARQDLDLYLKRLSTPTPWFTSNTPFSASPDACAWHNCEARLRGAEMRPPQPSLARANWGYANSPASECGGGPQGSQWVALGYCANPRLDIDNNLSQGSGLPENINLDQPRDRDGFRIMVQNFTGAAARPIVNVYCGGIRVATYGAPPDVLTSFTDNGRAASVGAMWRVADVSMRVNAQGDVGCTVTALHPKGMTSGYCVTTDDPSF